jgi:hypothetical protein
VVRAMGHAREGGGGGGGFMILFCFWINVTVL